MHNKPVLKLDAYTEAKMHHKLASSLYSWLESIFEYYNNILFKPGPCVSNYFSSIISLYFN